MAIKFDSENKADNAIGIAFMEGSVGKHDMAATYAKFEKQPTYKNKDNSLLWSPNRPPDERLATYSDESARENHRGAVDYGHTALILRKGGIVARMVGFVPTKGMDQWPCPGKWVDNIAMLSDPLALSYEVINSRDATVMEDTMLLLLTARDEWKFKYSFPKFTGREDQNTFNCIGAALTVLIKQATETRSYWERLMKYCESGGFGQSKVKAGIMTGDFLV